ncbi:uncharacterized protein ATNIH1004_002558 [Aspergillus tanneri]|uniref:JmjC domain-containing protein n=1 Tax=Aspergillus tanneri TaxID=1220188 RepID=A0A5M9MZ03_9EURO|nr:uncharacterized protein ATNIH1004_002558 [Aspergillus tanneri]KAA8649879.1 hypothetical protein ATNIH1004_002558 [Aspergillus tanneri]
MGSQYSKGYGGGWVRVELRAGDLLVLPPSCPHAAFTTEDCLVVWGNFYTTAHLGSTLVGLKLQENFTEICNEDLEPRIYSLLERVLDNFDHIGSFLHPSCPKDLIQNPGHPGGVGDLLEPINSYPTTLVMPNNVNQELDAVDSRRTMKLSAILPAFAAFHLVQGLEAPVPGYGVEEFTWEVETKPGGPTVALNGTIQEIYAELIEINPIYDLDFAARATEASISNDDGTPHLRKRFDVTCNIYTKTLRTRIQEGITYLRGVSGRSTNGPGPGNCGRVSCSYNSAIWWRNDNTSPKTLGGFNNVADSAQVIINQCGPTSGFVSGEENHGDHWRGIVRWDSC